MQTGAFVGRTHQCGARTVGVVLPQHRWLSARHPRAGKLTPQFPTVSDDLGENSIAEGA
jgi:hypothetical protein